MAHPLWLATVKTNEGKEVRFTIPAMSLKHAYKKAGDSGKKIVGSDVEVIDVVAK